MYDPFTRNLIWYGIDISSLLNNCLEEITAIMIFILQSLLDLVGFGHHAQQPSVNVRRLLL